MVNMDLADYLLVNIGKLLNLISRIPPNVFTFVTIVVLIVTLLENRRQRQHSYKPNLLFRASYYSFVWYLREHTVCYAPDVNEYIQEENLGSFDSIEPFFSKILNEHYHSSFNIKLRNVGLGTASNIHYEWQYSTESWRKQLRSLDPKFSILCGHHNGIIVIGQNNAKDVKGNCSDILYNPKITCESYVLSNLSLTENILEMSIPTEFLSTIISTFAMQPTKKTTCVIDGLQLKIDYRDIGNAKCSQSFEFVFSLIRLDRASDNVNKGYMLIRIDTK